MLVFGKGGRHGHGLALIGGMDRLERHYKNKAERAGVSLKVFNLADIGLAAKIRNVDAVVVFTN